MYALPNKTQHKLIVKVRGGLPQKLDNLNSQSSASSSSASLSSNKQTLFGNQKNDSYPSVFKSMPSIKESAFAKHIDEAGFNAELNHLPQPIFQPISEKSSSKSKASSNKQQYITPQHNEMIKYVQQSWKDVERDYKKSAATFINSIDLNNSSMKQKQQSSKKKTASAPASTPLLLSGSYHHSSIAKDSRRDSFRPFDLEAFWGNRILKRLTEEI